MCDPEIFRGGFFWHMLDLLKKHQLTKWMAKLDLFPHLVLSSSQYNWEHPHFSYCHAEFSASVPVKTLFPVLPLKVRDWEQLGFYSENTKENPADPGLCNMIRYVWNLLRLTDPLYHKLSTGQGFAIHLVQCWKEAWQADHLHILASTPRLQIVSPFTCLNASTPKEWLGKRICRLVP